MLDEIERCAKVGDQAGLEAASAGLRARLVLADKLLERDDPQGELIRLGLELEDAADDQRSRRGSRQTTRSSAGSWTRCR